MLPSNRPDILCISLMLEFKHICRQISWLTGIWLLTACGESGQQYLDPSVSSKEIRSVPSVFELTRYYADLMAHETRFADFSRRPFADSLLVIAPDKASFTLSLPNCVLSGQLDTLQRLDDVYVRSLIVQLKPGQPLDLSRAPAARLMRLGELRRAFGPGKVEEPSLTEEVSTSLFTVSFRYRPVKNRRSVTIEANMHIPNYADTTRVAFISMSPLE